jgi:hypothetical protein
MARGRDGGCEGNRESHSTIVTQKETYFPLCQMFVPFADMIGDGIQSGYIVDADKIIAPKSFNVKTGMLTKMHAMQASHRPQHNKSKNAAVMLLLMRK